MPQLGPFIIQSSTLTWLIIKLDEGPNTNIQQLLYTPFDKDESQIPQITSYKSLEPKYILFRAFDPSNSLYFTLIITNGLEIFRCRPANCDAFLQFQFNGTNTQFPPVFLEKYRNGVWLPSEPKIKLTEHAKINYFSLRDEIEPLIKTIIQAQYQTIAIENSSWEIIKEQLATTQKQQMPELHDNGFYFILQNLKTSCITKAEYINALCIVLRTKSKNSSVFLMLGKEAQDSAINLLRYFYDVNLHPQLQPKEKGVPPIPPLLDEQRFISMQEAILNEDESLKEKIRVSYHETIALRDVLFPQPIIIDPYEVAKRILLCRASKQYLLQLGISINKSYLEDNYGNNYTTIRSILDDVCAMLDNKESHWEICTCFEAILLEENPDYSVRSELERLKELLNKYVDDLTKKNARNYSQNPTENNLRQIFSNIVTLHDLQIAMKILTSATEQKKLLNACRLTNTEQQPLINTLDDLQKITATLHEPSNASIISIFNTKKPEQWGNMAESGDCLNLLFKTFNSDCVNRLIKYNRRHFSSILQTENNLIACFNNISKVHIWSLLRPLAHDVRCSYLQTTKPLFYCMHLSTSEEFLEKLRCIFMLIPSPHKITAIKYASIPQRRNFFQHALIPNLKVYFATLSKDEWSILSATAQELQIFINQLTDGAQLGSDGGAKNFMSSIPNHIKDYFFNNIAAGTEQSLNKPTKNISFDELKKVISQIFYPSFFPRLSSLWVPAKDPFNSALTIQDLKFAVLDKYCLNQEDTLCIKASEIIQNYIHNQVKNTKINEERMPSITK